MAVTQAAAEAWLAADAAAAAAAAAAAVSAAAAAGGSADAGPPRRKQRREPRPWQDLGSEVRCMSAVHVLLLLLLAFAWVEISSSNCWYLVEPSGIVPYLAADSPASGSFVAMKVAPVSPQLAAVAYFTGA